MNLQGLRRHYRKYKGTLIPKVPFDSVEDIEKHLGFRIDPKCVYKCECGKYHTGRKKKK